MTTIAFFTSSSILTIFEVSLSKMYLAEVEENKPSKFRWKYFQKSDRKNSFSE